MECRGMGSNCTFMELKYLLGAEKPSALPRSNCTFMELKFAHWSYALNR